MLPAYVRESGDWVFIGNLLVPTPTGVPNE
jgi:hypothetical protein